MTARYAIFVHDPDGDMGYGRIVGPTSSLEKAEAKAATIVWAAERQGSYVEAIVLDVEPLGVSAKSVATEVLEVRPS